MIENFLYKDRSYSSCIHSAYELMFNNFATIFRRTWLAALVCSAVISVSVFFEALPWIQLVLLIPSIFAVSWLGTSVMSLLNEESRKRNYIYCLQAVLSMTILAFIFAVIMIVAGTVILLLLGNGKSPEHIDTVYAEEVFTEILSGGEYSLLNEIIKNKNNTAIYVTDIGLFNHYNGLFGAMAVVPKGNGEKFKNEAMAIIEDIASGNIDDNRIEKAKNRLKSKCVFEEENVSSLAHDIGFSYVLDFKDYHLNYEKGIEKVTKADIIEAAKRMTSGPMYFGITTN